MSIGPAEIIIVLILALLVFGPKRLPQMGKSLGRGVREFKKAADTAKTELGLGEVTDGINDIKSTFTEPVKEVTGTFSDLKKSVDVKSAIEAPVGGAAVATATGAGVASVETSAAEPADAGPETPDVTPGTVFADIGPPPEPARHDAEEAAPEAPEAPEAPTAPAEKPEEPVAKSSSPAVES